MDTPIYFLIQNQFLCNDKRTLFTLMLDCKLLSLLIHSYRITLSPDGTLRLANVSKSDAGSYTCFARNRFGMSSTTGRLLVTGKLRC